MVFVFDTKKDMYAFYLAYCEESGWDRIDGSHSHPYGISPARTYDGNPDFEAIGMPWRYEGDGPPKDMGMVLFYKKRVTHGIVAHELGHMAIHYERCLNGVANFGDGNCEAEERVLYNLTHLVDSFHKKCRK